MYTPKKCIGCRACIAHCPHHAIYPAPGGMKTNREACRLCGQCADACPAKAMEMSGTEYSVDELMREIEKETIFIDRSGGGVTFCGGVNADTENITRSAAYLASLPWEDKVVHLLPYHDIAKGKHEKLGTLYNPGHLPLSLPSEEVQQRSCRIFRQHGIQTVIGG
jgi:Fe-S-cluster-containing hydrogenase component 2